MSPAVVRSDDVSWGYQDLLLFTFLSLVAVLVSQLAMRLLAGLLHVEPKSALILIPSQLLLYAGIFAVLFALIKLQYGREFWPSLAWTDSSVAPAAAFLMGLACAFAVQIVGVLLHTPDLFGALHLAQNAFVWQLGLLIALAGVAFGAMREWTGSTRASTWMHAGFNSTVFLYLFQAPKLPHL